MRILIVSIVLTLAGAVFVPASFAQGTVKTGPDISVIRDPELEKDSVHDLDVARQYFKLKKAYVAALKRCETIDAANPTFSKIDEVLYIAGLSSLRLAENKGKQPMPKDKTADDMRQDARVYLSRLVLGYPQSEFAKKAASDLQALGGPIEPQEPKP